MASAVIGALRVDLGINTAAFNAGLKTAGSKLSGFGGMMRSAIVPLVGLATTAFAGLSIAIKKGINDADNMGKAAQKFGVAVDELSKLRYAADLADVSFETLGVSLVRLSKNMVSAAAGNKATAEGFASVGVAVTNADGSLRSSTAVLADLSDVFAGMPDGAQKTALAVQLLGKSGAEMIPLLNGGSASLRALGDEAQRAGLVISQTTAQAAERFNDSLTRLGGAARGLATKLAAALAPAMANIAEGAVVLVQNFGNVGNIAREVFSRMVKLAQAASEGMHSVALSIQASFTRAFSNILNAAGATFSALPGLSGLGSAATDQGTMTGVAAGKLEGRADAAASNAGLLLKEAMGPLQSIIGPIDAAKAKVAELGAAFDATAGGGGGGGGSGGGAKGLSDALEDLKSKADQVFADTRTPQEEFAAKMAELNDLVKAGLITWDTYGRAVKQAQDELSDVGSVGKSVFDGLSQSIMGLINGTETLGGVLQRVLGNVGDNLLTKGIGGLGKALHIPGAANGTNFAPGGAMLVGERGPELLNLPRGSRVTPNNKLGGGEVHVLVSFDQNGNLDTKIARVSGPVAAQVVKRMAPGAVANAQKRAG